MPPAPAHHRTVITVGTFDGIHVGHAELARRCIAHARRLNATPRALLFDPHPLEVLRPEIAPPRLSTFDQRRAILADLGLHEVHRLDPASGILATDAEDFIRHTIRDHAVAAWVEGPDFRFGRDRAGTVELLARLAPELGVEVDIAPPVGVALDNHHLVRASSSLVRTLITAGRVRDAARVLGRPYTLEGAVVRGERRGRTIGYPTANLDTPQLLPADGVYAGHALAQHGSTRLQYLAALSVGTKPTFHDTPQRTAEAFLLDAPTTPGSPALPGLPEYGWTLRITCAHWLREQLRFESLDALLDQMARDCDRARTLLAHRAEPHHV